MVEHNLAKVGVASSSLVFRSNALYVRAFYFGALVVELVDTQDLKSCDRCGRAGSSPARGTFIGVPTQVNLYRDPYAEKQV